MKLHVRRKSGAYLNLITHAKTTTAALKCNFMLHMNYITQFTIIFTIINHNIHQIDHNIHQSVKIKIWIFGHKSICRSGLKWLGFHWAVCVTSASSLQQFTWFQGPWQMKNRGIEVFTCSVLLVSRLCFLSSPNFFVILFTAKASCQK